MFKGCSVPSRTYSPSDESDIIVHYRSVDSYTDAGVTAATDTDAIQQVNDISGNGRHLIQTVAIRKPVLDAGGGLQGIPVINCDGQNAGARNQGESLKSAQFTAIAGPFDIFIVAQVDVHGTNDAMFDAFTANTLALKQAGVSGTVLYSQNGGIDSEFSDQIAGFLTIGGGFHLYRLKLASAASAVSEDLESTETTLTWQSAPPLHEMDGFIIGAVGGGVSAFTDMNWLECFVFNSIKTGAAETNIYNYIIDRYGLNVL